MGILDDYLGDDSIDDEPIGFEKPKDGTYEFEIGDASLKKWEKKGEEYTSFVIDYYLTDEDGEAAPKTSDFFTLPDPDVDPEDYTMREKMSLRSMRDRFYAFGFKKEEFNTIDRDDLVGISGVLTLKTNAKGFQNIVSITAEGVDRADEEEEEKPAPKKKAEAKAPRRAAETEQGDGLEPEFTPPSRRRRR